MRLTESREDFVNGLRGINHSLDSMGRLILPPTMAVNSPHREKLTEGAGRKIFPMHFRLSTVGSRTFALFFRLPPLLPRELEPLVHER